MNECNPDARGLSGFAAFLAPTAILKSIADAATLRGGNAEKTTTDVLNNFATLRFAVSVGATILRIVFFVASATLGMWLCIYYVQKLSNDKCLGGQLIAQYASGNSSDRGGDAGADAPIGDTANDESSDVVAASGDDEAVVDVATADLLQQSLSSEASAHGATAGQKDLLSILPPLQAQSSPAAAPIAPPSQTVPAAAPSPIAAQSSPPSPSATPGGSNGPPAPSGSSTGQNDSTVSSDDLAAVSAAAAQPDSNVAAVPVPSAAKSSPPSPAPTQGLRRHSSPQVKSATESQGADRSATTPKKKAWFLGGLFSKGSSPPPPTPKTNPLHTAGNTCAYQGTVMLGSYAFDIYERGGGGDCYLHSLAAQIGDGDSSMVGETRDKLFKGGFAQLAAAIEEALSTFYPSVVAADAKLDAEIRELHAVAKCAAECGREAADEVFEAVKKACKKIKRIERRLHIAKGDTLADRLFPKDSSAKQRLSGGSKDSDGSGTSANPIVRYGFHLCCRVAKNACYIGEEPSLVARTMGRPVLTLADGRPSIGIVIYGEDVGAVNLSYVGQGLHTFRPTESGTSGMSAPVYDRQEIRQLKLCWETLGVRSKDGNPQPFPQFSFLDESGKVLTLGQMEKKAHTDGRTLENELDYLDRQLRETYDVLVHHCLFRANAICLFNIGNNHWRQAFPIQEHVASPATSQ